MPGTDKIKYKRSTTKSMRDQANEFSSVKKKTKSKQANEFAGLGSGSKSKQKQANEFVGIKKKTKSKQANEFAGLGTKTKTKTKTPVPVSKPKDKIAALVKAKKKNKTVKVDLPKTRPNTNTKTKTTPMYSPDGTKPKASGKNKIVSSLKTSRAGTDEAKGDNNKTPKKILSFFDKIIRDTKKNFSGDFKKKTGRYKSISTGKTNFNKKK